MTTSDVTEVDVPASLARRFEAVMFDWDGTAVADLNAPAPVVILVNGARISCKPGETRLPAPAR
jgi:hypothetical protein